MAKSTVKVSVGGGAYTDVTAPTTYEIPTAGNNNQGDVYESVADVTAAVSGVLSAIAAQVSALRDVIRTRPLPPQGRA